MGFKRRVRVTKGMSVVAARERMVIPCLCISAATTRASSPVKASGVGFIWITVGARWILHKMRSVTLWSETPPGSYLDPDGATLKDVLNLQSALVATIRAESAVRGWSVRQLSENANIPKPTMRNYLEKDRPIPVPVMVAVAAAFGWRTSELIKEAERRIDAEMEREFS